MIEPPSYMASRLRPYFIHRQDSGHGYKRSGFYLPERWICRLCRKELKPNNAGAQSHLAKHLREQMK